VDYREHAPSPALASVVRCYWTLHDPLPSVARAPERIIPDGRMEIVVHLGDPFSRLASDGSLARQRRAVLAGQAESALLLLPGRRVDLFAIRFHAWGAAGVLGVPAHTLTGRLPALDDVLGAAGEELAARVAAETDTRARIEAAERWLLPRLARARAPSARTQAAVRLATRPRDPLGVSALADAVGWTRRGLERAFREEVGLAPGVLRRVARLQRVLARLRVVPDPAWVALALEAGYCDQPHLVREFRTLAGLTPTQFLREQHALTDALVSGG
jgi:AraC-like DNA-binding protein